jgi:hypothetical protein
MPSYALQRSSALQKKNYVETTLPQGRAVMDKKKQKTDILPSDQAKRFVGAARNLGCDENEDAFDAKLKKVASSPPPKTTTKRKTKKPAK